VLVTQAHRFCLDPMPGQERRLGSSVAAEPARASGTPRDGSASRAARAYSCPGSGLSVATSRRASRWASSRQARRASSRRPSRAKVIAGSARCAARSTAPIGRRQEARTRSGNRGLRRAIHDAALGHLRRQLQSKTVWRGSQLIEAPTFYPSSKTCSACGAAKAKLHPSERTFLASTAALFTTVPRTPPATSKPWPNCHATVAALTRPSWRHGRCGQARSSRARAATIVGTSEIGSSGPA
jgi:hypothetical protein